MSDINLDAIGRCLDTHGSLPYETSLALVAALRDARAQVAAALRFAEDLIEAAHDLRSDYGTSLEHQAHEYEAMARTLRGDINDAVTRK